MRKQGRGVHIPMHELAELEQRAADQIQHTAERTAHGRQMMALRAQHERRTQAMHEPTSLMELLNGILNQDLPKDAVMQPALNAFRDHERYALLIPMPGMRKEDVKLEIIEENGEAHLHLTGEYKDPFAGFDPEKAGYLKKEYPIGKLRRCLGLPDDVDSDKITSEIHNGMLLVNMPRNTEQLGATKSCRSINIRSRD